MMQNQRFLKSMNKLGILFLLFLAISCDTQQPRVFSNPDAAITGIDFANTLTETDELNILDYLYFYNGGGVAIGDVDNDGLPDIFFSGNQVKNKLYRNKGNLTFEDITHTAGVAGNSTWNTGTVMGDVNGDGLLDIYVCAVVGIKGFNGYNELYINNGTDSSGAVTFTESAAKYGLDFDSYSSSAAFLDYDLDGDLDMYLLNHAVHTQESFGNAELRRKRDFQTGDKLLRNDGGKFTDVSEEAGIYGGINGYGLGVAVADFNQDGYPDIYVGNDFHEDDYYYLNKGDGTFEESLRTYFGHTSRFSMGNDVADINHDGWPDIMSLDMLPEEEKVLKESEGDDNPQTQKMRTERFGYYYQYTRNMLHINRKGKAYQETALMSGVAATDWSWSALFADYNQDGEQDIFVSNGIPKRPNNIDFVDFVSNGQIQKKIDNTKLVDQEALNLMPSGKTHNYVFQGTGSLGFEDRSSNWISNDTLVSGATAMADLDNDGDLDIVTNNLDQTASLYINETNEKANYLKLRLQFSAKNNFGIGAKVFSYHDGMLQYKELYTARGFQASSEPVVHFGYGATPQVDSLKIVWPDNRAQILRKVATNQTLVVTPSETFEFDHATLLPKEKKVFTKIPGNLGIDFLHKEDSYIDFNRQKLIPYQVSDRGPAIAVGDLNGDGRDDVFFGGSKYLPAQVFVQNDTAFTLSSFPSIVKDSIKEDVVAFIEDLDQDGRNDLLVGTGGADFFQEMKPLLDSYYKASDSTFQKGALPANFGNTSVIAPHDFDGDGDLDLFLGNQAVSNDFGKTPVSVLLQNEMGAFTPVHNPDLQAAGMITDAIWDDFDGNGTKDLILIGEWMAPLFFKNTNGELVKTEVGIDHLKGLWQAITPFDIDQDGDTDYLVGNWGSNTKLKASEENPLQLFYGDFDKNGQSETITTQEKNGRYYPLEGLKEMASQLVFLKKKFNTNSDFAGKDITEILDKELLETATVLTVNELRSGVLKNENGRYVFVPFEKDLQTAPITAFATFDFDGDKKTEVLVGGNYFGVKPYHGRFDSFPGALINDEKNVILGDEIGLRFMNKSIRHLDIISLNNQSYLLVTINNDQAQLYQIN